METEVKDDIACSGRGDCVTTWADYHPVSLLDHIVQTYASYHNQYRPHQGLGNRPLGVPEDRSRQRRHIDVGQIRRTEWLGGMLRHYYRRAA